MSSLRGDRKTSFGGGAGGVNTGRVSFGIDCSCTGSIGGTINVRSFGPDLSGSREGTKKGLSSGVNLCGSGSEDGAARVLSFGAGLSITGSTGPVTGSGSGLGSGSVSGKDAGSGLDSGSASGEDAGSGLGSGSRLGMISGSPRLPSGMFSIGPEKGVPCAFRWMLLSVSLEGCASNKGGVVGGVLFMSTSFFGGRATIGSSGAKGAESGETFSFGSGGAIGEGSSMLGFCRMGPGTVLRTAGSNGRRGGSGVTEVSCRSDCSGSFLSAGSTILDWGDDDSSFSG